MTYEPVHIDMEDAVRALTRAVERKGGDHTAECRYWGEDDAPVCIVAYALVDLGVDPSVVSTLPDDTIRSESVTGRLAWNGVSITPAARAVLGRAQAHQDEGLNWKCALDEAMRSARKWGWEE